MQNIINIFDNYIQNINYNNTLNYYNFDNSFFNILNRDINYNYDNYTHFNNLSNLSNENNNNIERDREREGDYNLHFYNFNNLLSNDFLENDYLDMPDLIDGNSNYNIYEDVKIVLNEEDFDKLKSCKFKDLNYDESKECLICIEYFNKEDDITKINCNHIFHKNCIKSWLCYESNKCPICRIDIEDGVIKID
jgi:hypothetical protein